MEQRFPIGVGSDGNTVDREHCSFGTAHIYRVGLHHRYLMKLLSQYLDHALKFESLAAAETNPKLRALLSGQATAYRQLAAERATKLGLPQPSAPEIYSSEFPSDDEPH